MRQLLGSRSYCMVKAENQLMRHLAARIKANGPLPVAEYMKEVLTNPVAVSWINNKYCYDPLRRRLRGTLVCTSQYPTPACATCNWGMLKSINIYIYTLQTWLPAAVAWR